MNLTPDFRVTAVELTSHDDDTWLTADLTLADSSTITVDLHPGHRVQVDIRLDGRLLAGRTVTCRTVRGGHVGLALDVDATGITLAAVKTRTADGRTLAAGKAVQTAATALAHAVVVACATTGLLDRAHALPHYDHREAYQRERHLADTLQALKDAAPEDRENARQAVDRAATNHQEYLTLAAVLQAAITANPVTRTPADVDATELLTLLPGWTGAYRDLATILAVV